MQRTFEATPINHDETLSDEDTILVGRLSVMNSQQHDAAGRSNHEETLFSNGGHEPSEINDGGPGAGGTGGSESIVVEPDDVDSCLGENEDELTVATYATTPNVVWDRDPATGREGLTEDDTASAVSLSRYETAASGESVASVDDAEPPAVVSENTESTTEAMILVVQSWLGIFVNSTVAKSRSMNNRLVPMGSLWIVSFAIAFWAIAWAKFPIQSSSSSSSSFATTTTAEEHLQSFVAFERNRNDLVDIADLKTEGFKHYAQSACMFADSFEKATTALELQLADLPSNIRERLIQRALIEGVTQSSSIQDSSSSSSSWSEFDNDSEPSSAQKVDQKANSYLAYWSTVFRPNGNEGGEYETCVVISSMEIDVAEDIVTYEEEEKKVVVGTRPCGCGFFSCSGMCPTYETVRTKRPLFKTYSLSLKNQEDLHRWLVKHAIDAAEALLGKKAYYSLPNTSAPMPRDDSKPLHNDDEADSSTPRD